MNIDLQPSLFGRLVMIRPLVKSDFEPLYNAASDALIWEQHQDKERYTRKGYSHYFRNSLASGGAFCIQDNKDKSVIGSSRFKIIDPEDGVVEIGWTFLQRKYWGGHYNREVKRLMVNYALRYFRIVVFYVNDKNTRSQKALKKIGATRITDSGLSWVLDPSEGQTYAVYKEIR